MASALGKGTLWRDLCERKLTHAHALREATVKMDQTNTVATYAAFPGQGAWFAWESLGTCSSKEI